MGFLDSWNPFEALGELLNLIISLIFYPVFSFVVGVFSSFINLVNQLIGLLLDIVGLGGSVLSWVSSFLSLFFVDTWTTIILLQIAIIVILRFYYFAKDVEIFGFKV